MSDNVVMHDNRAQNRYEIKVGDEVAGFTLYYLEGDRIALVHTEVDVAYEGQGLGGRLARHALDDARKRGLRVTPSCPFFKRYIGMHPEYKDLVRTGEKPRRVVLGDLGD